MNTYKIYYNIVNGDKEYIFILSKDREDAIFKAGHWLAVQNLVCKFVKCEEISYNADESKVIDIKD